MLNWEDKKLLEGESRGPNVVTFCEEIKKPSTRNEICGDGGKKNSVSCSNIPQVKTTKWMNKKSSAIEKVMGNLKERSTRKNIDKSTTIIAVGGMLNKPEDISKNKSVNLREYNSGTKTVHRRN